MSTLVAYVTLRASAHQADGRSMTAVVDDLCGDKLGQQLAKGQGRTDQRPFNLDISDFPN